MQPPLAMVIAPVIVILPGLWLISYFYSYDQQPETNLVLLAAATLAGSLGLLPGIRGLRGWQRDLICVLAAFVLAVGSVMAARGTRNEEEDLLRWPVRMRTVTMANESRRTLQLQRKATDGDDNGQGSRDGQDRKLTRSV